MQTLIRRPPPLALVAALLLDASTVRAEPGDASPTPALTSPNEPVEIQVVADRADAIQKLPGSFTVLDAREIAHAQPLQAGELLRRVPGLNVREDPAAGGRLDIGIRGLDPGRSRRLLVLEDGVPLAINPYAEPDLYFVPQVERVARIEVLKGSGSILFGPQTIGGVVNFGTIAPPYRTEGFSSVEVGDYGYVRSIGRFGTALRSRAGDEPVRMLAQVVVKSLQGPRDQPMSDLDGLAKIAFPTGNRGQAMLKLAAHRQRGVSEDVGLTRGMFETDPRRAGLTPESRIDLQRFDAVLTHDLALADGVTLKTLAYGTATQRVWGRQRYDRAPAPGERYVRIVGDPDAPGGAIYFRDSSRILDRSHWIAGIEPRLTARLSTGSVGHTIDAGMRVLLEGARLDERDGANARSTDGTLTTNEVHASGALAAYVQDRIALFPWLVVTPGARVEVARYLREVDDAPGASHNQGADGVAGFVPGIGATVGTPELHGFAGVHMGFAPPRLTSVVRAEGTTEPLDPERSTNVEIGFRARPSAWVTAEGTLFATRFVNQIVPNTQLGAATELVNGGATSSLGADASLRVGIARALGAAFDLDVGVRGGGLASRFDSGENVGKSLPYAPPYTVSATLDGGIPSTGLSATAAVTHIGPQFADDRNTLLPDASGRVGRIDAYTLVDLMVRYAGARSGIGVFASARNLLDRAVVVARRPEGIFTAGFRQVTIGISYAVH